MELFHGFNLRWYILIILVSSLLSTESFSVVMEPSDGLKEYSDFFFTGTVVSLHCTVNGVHIADAKVSIYFNDSLIFENKGQITNGRGILFGSDAAKNAYRLQINNPTLEHRGEYLCKVETQLDIEEDSFFLNVVSDSPQCISHCNELEEICQLICYSKRLTVNEYFKWYKSQDGIMFEAFHGFNSFPYLANKGVSNFSDSFQDLSNIYKCSVESTNSGQTFPERSCIFNISKPTSSGSVPLTTGADHTIDELSTFQLITSVTSSVSDPSTISRTLNIMDEADLGWVFKGVLSFLSLLVFLLFITTCFCARKLLRKISNDEVSNATEPSVYYQAGYMTSTSFVHITLDQAKHNYREPKATTNESAKYTHYVIEPEMCTNEEKVESQGKVSDRPIMDDGYCEPRDFIQRPYLFTRPYSVDEICEHYPSNTTDDVTTGVDSSKPIDEREGSVGLNRAPAMVDNIVYEPYYDSHIVM